MQQFEVCHVKVDRVTGLGKEIRTNCVAAARDSCEYRHDSGLYYMSVTVVFRKALIVERPSPSMPDRATTRP